MRKIILLSFVLMLVAVGCSRPRYRLEGSLGSNFDGKTVVLANYDDLVAIDSVKMQQGRFLFEGEVSTPQMAMLMVDGKVRAYLVLEGGQITLADSTYFATGTPTNDNLNNITARLDSVEQADDMNLYVTEVQKLYDANRENPAGLYLAVELSRYLEAPQIEQMLEQGGDELKQSHRITRYHNAALMRQATAPGMKFTDFAAIQPDGREMKLSDYAGRGKYVLVDFWASWCPYCIKELPQLREIYAKYGSEKLEIVGVAVRDREEDTRDAMAKYGVTWPVMFNAQRIPYDIYGFTGIPHLMLLAPDGTIVARGESTKETAERLEQLISQ